MSAATAATACTIRRTRCRPSRRPRPRARRRVEIDVVLTADGEPIVLHDLTVDRTTDGHGFAADLTLAEIRALDAGDRVRSALRRNEDSDAGGGARLGEARRTWGSCSRSRRPSGRTSPSIAWPRLLKATGTTDRVIVISFDHVVLKRRGRAPSGAEDRGDHACPPRRHRRRAESVRRELGFDRARHVPSGRRAKALHEAGFSNRVHMPRPEELAEYWRGGRDPLPDLVQWIADGLIDTISGDDVPFIARLVAARRQGRLSDDHGREPTELDHRLRVAEAVVREAGRVAADHFARRELLQHRPEGRAGSGERGRSRLRGSDRRRPRQAFSPRTASSARSAARATRTRRRSGSSIRSTARTIS